jgi:hypothetical protein
MESGRVHDGRRRNAADFIPRVAFEEVNAQALHAQL